MIVPLTVVLIFLMLFALYGNFKFPITIVLGVVLTEPVGALHRARNSPTRRSACRRCSDLLALIGVSVQTAVIFISYINELRLRGHGNSRGHALEARCCGCGRS